MKASFAHATRIGGLLLACCSCAASGKATEERWVATSTAAYSITGDILLSPTRLRTERADFPLRVVADNARFRGEFGVVPARVLAVTKPRNPVLLNGNKLCRQSVRWFVVSHTKAGQLELDIFEGKQMPTSARSAGVCGVLFYSRP
jgi:hypothetical protein